MGEFPIWCLDPGGEGRSFAVFSSGGSEENMTPLLPPSRIGRKLGRVSGVLRIGDSEFGTPSHLTQSLAGVNVDSQFTDMKSECG